MIDVLTDNIMRPYPVTLCTSYPSLCVLVLRSLGETYGSPKSCLNVEVSRSAPTLLGACMWVVNCRPKLVDHELALFCSLPHSPRPMRACAAFCIISPATSSSTHGRSSCTMLPPLKVTPRQSHAHSTASDRFVNACYSPIFGGSGGSS